MSRSLINGAEQINSSSIPWSAMASGAIVPTSSLVDGSLFIKSNGSVSMTAALNLGGYTAQNSGLPTNATDLASKAYVDAKVAGFSLHGARLLSASNVSSLSGTAQVDGVTPNAGDVVLLTAQTTTSQNGPWVVASGSWTRPTWWASGSTVPEGAYFLLDPDGTTYKDTKWWMTTTGTITVDTTGVSFLQDNSGTTYTAGTGLSLVGSTFSVNYGTTSSTAAVGNDSRIVGALQTSALGSGVQTILGNAATGTGSLVAATSPALVTPALGTPQSGTLTSCTGLPFSTGLTGTLQSSQMPTFTGDVTNVGLAMTVNNTSGSGFTKYGNFIYGETPGGTPNGSNTAFTLANSPSNSGANLQLYLNGQRLKSGSGNDYTISGANITMLFAPATGDTLLADYLK
jgi:hypothetical protein